jgi:hypothetical protein
MRFDINYDLRAATLLSALGLDPRQVMGDLGQVGQFEGGLNLLGDGFDRIGGLGASGILNLLQNGALPPSALMPMPVMRNSPGFAQFERGFDPRDFPPGSMGQRLAGFFNNNPFARQELERMLGGRIIPSGLHPSGFAVQRFAPGAFPGGGLGNTSALEAYSMLAGIDRAAAFAAGQQFGAENAFQSMMMGALAQIVQQQQGAFQPNRRLFSPTDFLDINPDGTPRGASANAFGGIPGFGGFNGGGFPGFGGATGFPSPTQGAFGIGGGEDTNAVMADGSLTVEDKVTLLIMMIMKKMDKDIEAQANYINALQQQQNGGGGKGGGKGGGGGGSPSIDVETMKLKRLIDKRSQMFDMLRQIIDKYNQTAKGIIDSMGR